MEAVFQAPKRRLKIWETFDSPLPVLLGEDAGARAHSLTYRGDLHAQHVIVTQPSHVHALYGKGYFGKGILSKSRPEHSISERWEYVGDTCLPVIPLSKYQEHVRWARAAFLAEGFDDKVVSQMLQKMTCPVALSVREERAEERAEDYAEEHPEEHTEEHVEMGVCHSPSSSQDQSMEDVAIEKGPIKEEEELGYPETKRPRRQGNPLYDPLAELYAEEPRQVDPNALAKVKCKRHDDWIVHCGCLLDESQMMGVLSESDSSSCDPSLAAGYVLVEEPEDEEGEDISNQTHKSVRSKLVCRINPFNMTEHLQLSYEEAFFLVYALGCLSIYNEGEPLSILQVWRMFREAQPNFETTYAAYHHFRSKGWVPKSGIKYGTDLVLYRKGPPFYHASYSVVVEKVDESFKGASLRPFSWRSLAALSRITGNVSKELMLCYIIMPSGIREEELSSPEFLKSVKVQELLVSRWISSRERTEQDEI